VESAIGAALSSARHGGSFRELSRARQTFAPVRKQTTEVTGMAVLFEPTLATHTTLECVDVVESIRFYREVMGLATLRRLKMAAVFRATNGLIAACIQVPRPAPQPLLNFYARPVRDRVQVEATHAAVTAVADQYGIQEITRPSEEDPARFGVGTYGFYLKDRDGNWWRIEENKGPFGPVELPEDAEPRGSIVPAGPISYVTLECKDIQKTIRFYSEFLGIDVEQQAPHYFFSRGNGGVCLIGVEVPDVAPQPVLNHHGITLRGEPELIDRLRDAVVAHAEDFGVMKVLPATSQHGSYSFYMQDLDTNWWEIEILEELDPYHQTMKDGEWSEETAAAMGARFSRHR
jgi:catechol 2,3-dioxygenase-like lactoylglutathione lyase family enzyme